MLETDVAIIGAGPGGAATALRLSYLGIPSVLIDKATFPRDKICGDAISGKVTTLLNRLDPGILQRFQSNPAQLDVWGIRFVAPNGKNVDVPFQSSSIEDGHTAPGYVSKRFDFDNFLVQEVKRRPDIALYEGTAIQHFERTERGFLLSSGDHTFQVHARLLIVANGAQSAFSRHVAGLEKDPAHHAGALRAYYRNVRGFTAQHFIELHFLKDLTPGYFWIFPLPGGEANVGVGMRTDIIKRKKVNLKQVLQQTIAEHPLISPRFREATLIGEVEGYGLPLGSKSRPISGDHFMLVGDAGHLIDPLTGEGIGNAFYSGFIAAEQAQQCLLQQDFSASFLKAYDQRVARVLGSEMKLSHRMQRVGAYPFLLNIVAGIISGNRQIISYFSRMYTDFQLRQQLVNPVFWINLLLRRKM